MGYCMAQEDSHFQIKAAHHAAALAAVKALAGEETCTDSTGKHFSWVDARFLECRTLSEILRAWRWDAEFNEAGDICDVAFAGEKLGDDMLLLTALAPYVEDGSSIEMRGEDGYHWRWFFDGKTCHEHAGPLVYEGDY